MAIAEVLQKIRNTLKVKIIIYIYILNFIIALLSGDEYFFNCSSNGISWKNFYIFHICLED